MFEPNENGCREMCGLLPLPFQHAGKQLIWQPFFSIQIAVSVLQCTKKSILCLYFQILLNLFLFLALFQAPIFHVLLGLSYGGFFPSLLLLQPFHFLSFFFSVFFGYSPGFLLLGQGPLSLQNIFFKLQPGPVPLGAWLGHFRWLFFKPLATFKQISSVLDCWVSPPPLLPGPPGTPSSTLLHPSIKPSINLLLDPFLMQAFFQASLAFSFFQAFLALAFFQASLALAFFQATLALAFFQAFLAFSLFQVFLALALF